MRNHSLHGIAMPIEREWLLNLKDGSVKRLYKCINNVCKVVREHDLSFLISDAWQIRDAISAFYDQLSSVIGLHALWSAEDRHDLEADGTIFTCFSSKTLWQSVGTKMERVYELALVHDVFCLLDSNVTYRDLGYSGENADEPVFGKQMQLTATINALFVKYYEVK